MLKQGSDFLFEIAVIRDTRSRDNEGRLYFLFQTDTTIYVIYDGICLFGHIYVQWSTVVSDYPFNEWC